jgi:hypothetical protein
MQPRRAERVRSNVGLSAEQDNATGRAEVFAGVAGDVGRRGELARDGGGIRGVGARFPARGAQADNRRRTVSPLSLHNQQIGASNEDQALQEA